MPELRRDPVVGRWVIVAAERERRPNAFAAAGARWAAGVARGAAEEAPCPFCPGQERETPPEVAAIRPPGSPPDSPGWQVRVVPNRYPALCTDVDPSTAPREGDPPAGTARGHELFECRPGFGIHEVVIETPEHVRAFADLEPEAMAVVLSVYQDRVRVLAGDERIRYVQLFRNDGAPAGATQAHAHAQIIATPIVPTFIGEETAGARQHRERTGTCLYCEIAAAERADDRRLLLVSEKHLAIAPYASRFPYECCILPIAHAAAFEESPSGDLLDLAITLRAILQAVARELDDPAYNLVLHTAPVGAERSPFYHWHIEIIPRTAQVAGFEWGTGYYINSVAPEEATARLRNFLPRRDPRAASGRRTPSHRRPRST